MLTIETIVQDHPFFTDLRPEYIEELIQCASYVHYQTGEKIFREGNDADRFFLLGRGRVSLEVSIPNRGIVPMMTVHEGDVLGWSWLFPPYKWQFDARALEASQAVTFKGHCLRDRCKQDHELGYELMRRFAQVMMQRLQATRMQLLDVYSLNP